MTDITERLRSRADELPQEIAELENERQGVCGAFGTDTAADYMDDYDRLVMIEAADEIERLRAALNAVRKVFEPLDASSWHPGNGFRHDHMMPGIWDDDSSNGDRRGKACEWCADWAAARTALRGQG